MKWEEDGSFTAVTCHPLIWSWRSSWWRLEFDWFNVWEKWHHEGLFMFWNPNDRPWTSNTC